MKHSELPKHKVLHDDVAPEPLRPWDKELGDVVFATWNNGITWDHTVNFITCWWQNINYLHTYIYSCMFQQISLNLISVTITFSLKPKHWSMSLSPASQTNAPLAHSLQREKFALETKRFGFQNLHLITHSPPQRKYIIHLTVKDPRLAARNFTCKNWGYIGGGFRIASLKLSHFNKQNTLPL